MSFDVEVRSRLREGPTGLPVMNMSGLDDEAVFQSSDLREVAFKLSRWVDRARAAGGNHSMFDRGSFTPPENPYDEMRAARMAVAHDEIVGGVKEITESFAFQGVKWEGVDPDEADVFNQISVDINLDDLLRRMWHDIYAFSQTIVGMIWGWKTYKVRGRTAKGNRRKKEVRVWCPIDVRTIDPMKVVPVGGSGPFGGDLLAWCTTNEEMWHYGQIAAGELVDPLMQMFFLDQYVPRLQQERYELESIGVDTSNLLLMNPEMVWRHTLTRPDYERFPEVRLKNLFPLLDIKRQLLRSDRAMLVGMANYILLIRKGTEEQPAKAEEINHLKQNYNFIAKLPVIISDHRLEIEIIAPRADFVLQRDRYDTIDQRIMTRLLNTLSLNTAGQRNEDQTTLARAVTRGMMNRRHMLRRTMERDFARAIVTHPRNRGKFESEPNLVYIPRSIQLNEDAAVIQAMMNLRTQRELSRETILEQFDLDQETEAQRREVEAEQYDDIFKTHTPYDSPEGDVPAQTGPQGGRPSGGGESTDDSTRVEE